MRVVIVVIIVVVVVCVGGFSLYRWLYGDDEADIQGMWYIAGTDTPILITADEIVLTDSVSYSYVVDSEAKTISFSLASMQGSGHYRFSFDRDQLAIMEGSYGWWNTFFSDFGWTARSIGRLITGKDVTPAAVVTDATDADAEGEGEEETEVLAEGTTLLSRSPATPGFVGVVTPSTSDEAVDSDQAGDDASGTGGTADGSGGGASYGGTSDEYPDVTYDDDSGYDYDNGSGYDDYDYDYDYDDYYDDEDYYAYDEHM